MQQAALKTAPAGNPFEGSLDVGCYGLNARVAMALAWVWAWRPDAGASEAKFLPPSPPPQVFPKLREAGWQHRLPLLFDGKQFAEKTKARHTR